MSNPNNGWAYNAPLPPGFTPPQPPPPPGKSGLTPPKGKNPGLALAMVCVMALVSLVGSVVPFLSSGISELADGILTNPLIIALTAAELLLTLLVYLQFILPGWEPRRKILGWLLGGSLLGTVASVIYGAVQGGQIALVGMQGILGDAAAAGVTSLIVIVVAVFAALGGIAFSPFFYLLLGIWMKKSMEKVAGVFACIALGSAVLVTPLVILVTGLGAGEFELPATLWTTTLPGIVSGICSVIFYFTWPVLDKPVLAKEEAEPRTDAEQAVGDSF